MVSSGRTKRFTSVFLAVALLSALALFALAQTDPTGPDSLNEISDSRFNITPAQNQTAQAGNVTQLDISAQTPTKAWQGYYGNISGTITLEDAAGAVFYDWTANEPEGEIYASTNDTINWDNIQCFGFNDNGAPNLTTEESRYGIDPNDMDGINETFSETNHDTFYVGTREIANDTCQSANPYVNSTSQNADFQNVLLDDGTDLVFTTIIENRDPANDTDLQGYDGGLYDFQMFVAEDEHNSTSAGPTTYYFWVEIE